MPEAPRVGCAMDGMATDVYCLEGGYEVTRFTQRIREKARGNREKNRIKQEKQSHVRVRMRARSTVSI